MWTEGVGREDSWERHQSLGGWVLGANCRERIWQGEAGRQPLGVDHGSREGALSRPV